MKDLEDGTVRKRQIQTRYAFEERSHYGSPLSTRHISLLGTALVQLHPLAFCCTCLLLSCRTSGKDVAGGDVAMAGATTASQVFKSLVKSVHVWRSIAG